MQPYTLTRPDYKSKIYVNNIRKNSCRIRIMIRIKSLRMHNTAYNQCYVSPSAPQLKDKVPLVHALSAPVPTGKGNGPC